MIHDKTSLKKKDIESVINSFIDVLGEDVLRNGHELRLRDFGTFKQKKSAARTGRNPRTGEPLAISSSTTVSFSPSSTAFKIKC